MRVVGYRDLRPVDWASGRRVPLEPGEGHLCDRCGAEHAVVYELLDEVTGKHYAVGSTCAKRQFGFDVERDAAARSLVRKAKDAAAAELYDARQTMVAEAAARLSREVSALPLPEFVRDSKALASFGRSDAETQRVALEAWFLSRVRERIPGGWFNISVRRPPGSRSKSSLDMGNRTVMLALSDLASTIR